MTQEGWEKERDQVRQLGLAATKLVDAATLEVLNSKQIFVLIVVANFQYIHTGINCN